LGPLLGSIFGLLGPKARKGSLWRVRGPRGGQGRPQRGPKGAQKGPFWGPFGPLLGSRPGGSPKPKQGKHPEAGPGRLPQKGPFRALLGPFGPLRGPKGTQKGGGAQPRAQTRNRGNIRGPGPRQGASPPTPPQKGPNSGTFGAPGPRSMLQDGVFFQRRIVVVLGPQSWLLMGGGRGILGRKTAKNTENRDIPLERGLVLGAPRKGLI